MWKRVFQLAGLGALCLQPAAAQFGVAGNRRQQGAAGTKFQDLQEKARQAEASTGSDDVMANLLDGFNDPEMMKQYEAAMGELAKMTPEQLQAQMADALKMFTDNDGMMDMVMQQKDAIIQNLEQSGSVPPDELLRYKTDNAYFEEKMKEGFGQMQDIFSNPEYIKMATDTMQTMAAVAQDPSKAFEGLAATLGSIADSDEKIEEARLEFLNGEFDMSALFGDAFKSDEMKEIINDPAKWRKAVKEGYDQLTEATLKDEL